MSRPSFPRHRRAFRSGLLSGSQPYIVLGASVLAVFLGLRLLAPGALISFVSPLWRFGTTATMALDGGSDETLAAENAALAARNAELEAMAADLTRLLGERTDPIPGIVAAVMARPPVAPYDTLVIDQGKEAGVSKGDLVSGPGGTPIGEVTSVDQFSGRVTLYSTRGSVQSGWAGEARVPVELSGLGSGAYDAVAARGSGLVAGDTVYLVQRGALPIGTVIAVDEDPSAPKATLYVRPYVNPFSLTWVTVIPAP